VNLFPFSQIVNLAPSLGLCVAMGTHEAVVGHLLPQGTTTIGQPPPADLRTYVCDQDGEFIYVEAITPDGAAFIDLLRET
jgi:hypothetical protein